MMRAPQINVTHPSGIGEYEVTANGFAISEVRHLIEQSGCRATVKHAGLFAKQFMIRGDQEALQLFTTLAWHSAALGPTFRETITEAVKSHG